VAFVSERNLFWKSVPFPAQMGILIADLLLLATLEGIQISLVALKSYPHEAYRLTHPNTYRISKLIYKGANFEKFLMGRQIFVVICVFFAARLTTQHHMTHLFHMPIPSWVQASIMDTGLLGVVVVAVFGQLTPQIVASVYPMDFVEMMPGVRFLCQMCLACESLGLVHLNYKVADFFVWIFRIKNKHESKDLLETAINTEMQAQQSRVDTNDERVRFKSAITNKLQALCEVMDRIAESNDVDQESEIFQLALQRHPHLFDSFPSAIGHNLYASPQQIWAQIQSHGFTKSKPGFLCPVTDPSHVPPHIVAAQVIAQNMALRNQLLALHGPQAVVGFENDRQLEEAVARLLEDDVLVRSASSA